MKSIVFIFFVLFSTSCIESKSLSNKEITEISSDFNVQIIVKKHILYCGGAAPSFEMENVFVPVEDEFILVNKTKNTKTSIFSNHLGVIQLKLENGEYSLREKFKDVSYQDFYERHQKTSNNMISSLGEKCFKKWWSKNLNEFTIQNDTLTNISATLIEDCYTGNNPCLQYHGPQRP